MTGSDLRKLRRLADVSLVSIGVEIGIGGSGSTIARKMRRLEDMKKLPDDVEAAVVSLIGRSPMLRRSIRSGAGNIHGKFL